MNRRFILMALIFTWCGLWLTPSADAQTKTLTAEDNFRRATKLRKQKDLGGAIANYTKAIELNPSFTDAYADRCSAYLEELKPEAALADCDKAIQLNPKKWTAYYTRGMIYFSRRNIIRPEISDALQDFSTVISLKNDYSEAYFHRAWLYGSIGEREKAVLDLTKIIELGFPNLSRYRKGEVFSARGMIYSYLNKEDLALQDFAQALELNPALLQVYSIRGEVYFERKQYDLALRDFSAAAKLGSNPGFFYYKRGLVYKIKSQWSLALANFTRAIQFMPKNHIYYKERAAVYRTLGKTDLAAKDEETVRKLGF